MSARVLNHRPRPTPRQIEASRLREIWRRTDKQILELAQAVLEARELDEQERLEIMRETFVLTNSIYRAKRPIRRAQTRRRR